MVVQRHFDFEVDRVLRDNFSDEPGNFSPLYSIDYYTAEDFCSVIRGPEWAAILSLITVVLGGITSSLYLIVLIRHSTALTSNFLFLNNFLLASFINLLSNGIFDIILIRNHCWYGGRLLCKALPTILECSENAMILFIVAIILEENHPYVHSLLSKNTQVRKRLTVTILWIVTVVLSIPEVILWDIFTLEGFGGGFLCRILYHHGPSYAQKGLFLEYIAPLLLLSVTLIHAAAVSLKISNTPTANQAPEEKDSRNGENEHRIETDNQCPRIRVTSVVIGVVRFVTKTPFYLAHFLYAFCHVHSFILNGIGFVLYPIPSIVAPVVVMLSSPIHKKRLKETYQSITSCVAGRSVEERFLLSAEDEEKL